MRREVMRQPILIDKDVVNESFDLRKILRKSSKKEVTATKMTEWSWILRPTNQIEVLEHIGSWHII